MSCSDECKLLTVFTSEMKWNEMNSFDQNAESGRERVGGGVETVRNQRQNKHQKMHHE